MTGLREIFAYNLKEQRRQCGLTQADLAEKVKVSTHHIGMIEIARTYPTLELVERIARALDIEAHKLFINPLSPQEEMEHLYQTMAVTLNQLVAEAVEKAVFAIGRNRPNGIGSCPKGDG